VDFIGGRFGGCWFFEVRRAGNGGWWFCLGVWRRLVMGRVRCGWTVGGGWAMRVFLLVYVGDWWSAVVLSATGVSSEGSLRCFVGMGWGMNLV